MPPYIKKVRKIKQTPGAESGTRYGRLTVLKQLTFGRKGTVLCQCDCKNVVIDSGVGFDPNIEFTPVPTEPFEIRVDQLKTAVKKGLIPSCGCWSKERYTSAGLKLFDPTKYMQKRFGRLLVTGVSLDTTRKTHKNRLVCLCDCGGQAIVKPAKLINGDTTSCGCFHLEKLIENGKATIDHGHTTNGVLDGDTPLYRAWCKILAGVRQGWRVGAHTVCHEYDPRWDDFKEFYSDFGDIEVHQTISRHNKKMPWNKENCFINIGRRALAKKPIIVPLKLQAHTKIGVLMHC